MVWAAVAREQGFTVNVSRSDLGTFTVRIEKFFSCGNIREYHDLYFKAHELMREVPIVGAGGTLGSNLADGSLSSGVFYSAKWGVSVRFASGIGVEGEQR